MVNAIVQNNTLFKSYMNLTYIDIFCKDGSFDNVKRGSRPQTGKFDSCQCMVAKSLSYIYNLGRWSSGLRPRSAKPVFRGFESHSALASVSVRSSYNDKKI